MSAKASTQVLLFVCPFIQSIVSFFAEFVRNEEEELTTRFKDVAVNMTN